MGSIKRSKWSKNIHINLSTLPRLKIVSIFPFTKCKFAIHRCFCIFQQYKFIHSAHKIDSYNSTSSNRGLLLTWINPIRYKVWAGITYPFPNFNGCTIEVWEWINNFSLQFTGHVITYPWWDKIKPCLYKGPGLRFLWITLTHWGRVTHICVSKLTIIGSDNGLSPERRQAIIWTNAGILLMGPLETNFNEILIGIHTFSLKKMHFKMSSAKWRPFCFGLNVLNYSNEISTIKRRSYMCCNVSPHWPRSCLYGLRRYILCAT